MDKEIKEIIDKEKIMERVYGNKKILVKILNLFLDDCQNKLSAMRQAIMDNNSDELMKMAHKLKGEVANLTADDASEMALKLELIGEEGDLSKAEEAYSDLEKEIERLIPVLLAFKKEVQSSDEHS